jgi:[ribosomal protein S18]-alanine N-acetyltransferase
MLESRNDPRSAPPEGAGDESADQGSGPSVAEGLPMTASDLTEVAELEKICFRDPWSRASFEAELRAEPTSWCRIVRIGEQLAGYMIAWFIEDEAHLANIGVAPWARRRGHAQGMLDQLFREAYLRGSRVIVLEVRVSNQGAIQLYERNGFVVGGVRRNYYNNPREDALVMVRSLRLQEAHA